MKARFCVMGLLALPMMGCSIQGHWVADGAPPAGSKCKFQSMDFMKDSTFTASADIEGHVMPMQGKYSYNCCTGKLNVDSSDGKHRSYEAKVMGDKMKVIDKEGGTTIEQNFKKEGEMKKNEGKSAEQQMHS